MATEINWSRLNRSIGFYQSYGFKFIDLDWTIQKEVSEITKPIDRKDYFVENEALVASGEQSFLQLIINNELKSGRYCGITPCFRDEDKIDYLHQRYFMKVELISTINVCGSELYKILDLCKNFYSKYLPVEIQKIDENCYDIIDSVNKIELGSYGIRTHSELKWVYATGLAEPRLSKVINFVK